MTKTSGNNQANDTPKNDEKKKKIKWSTCFKRLPDYISRLKTILLNVTIVFLIIASIIFIWQEMLSEGLIIEPFDVSDDLQKQGYSGQVVAKHIMDRFYATYDTANTLKESKEIKPKWTREQISFEVPGTDLSLVTYQQILWRLFKGNVSVISGDIVKNQENPKFELTLRINDTRSLVQANTIQELIRKTAEALIQQTQPYILASYWFVKEQDKKSAEILRKILDDYSAGDKSNEYHAWAYILLGRIYDRANEYDMAIEQFDKAITQNPEFALAYNNKGITLARSGKTAEAIEVFKQCIQIQPDDWRAYYNLATTYSGKDKQYHEAELNFEKSLVLKKPIDEDYVGIQMYYINLLTHWGWKLTTEKNFRAAITKYEQAIHIDSRSNDGALKMNSKWYYPNLGVTLVKLADMLSTCVDTSLLDLDKAITYGQKAVRISSTPKEQKTALETLATAYERAGKEEKASDIRKQISELTSDDGIIPNNPTSP